MPLRQQRREPGEESKLCKRPKKEDVGIILEAVQRQRENAGDDVGEALKNTISFISPHPFDLGDKPCP